MKRIYKYKNSTIQMKLVNIARWKKKIMREREEPLHNIRHFGPNHVPVFCAVFSSFLGDYKCVWM